MYSGLLIILLPLTLGYLFRFKNKKILALTHRLLGVMVYIILFLMGITLALLDNISTHLTAIFIYTMVFFCCTFAANLIALLLLDKLFPWKIAKRETNKPLSRFKMILSSLPLCGVLILGFLLGLTKWPFLSYAKHGTEITLICLLLLVGCHLRNSGMYLRQILINFRGATIAVIVATSALLGGILAAFLLGLPTKVGLAIAAGYGWYSLTGILLTDAYGPVIGSTAFFNDLMRELAAIMLIPIIINQFRSTALGICGSTSMDFTLPILQRSGGVSIVPAAIVHGFVLSLLTPLLIAFFT
ncbi:lysine exporter LysO family protein [Candidatus Arsenophonus nilaparvatae]|uniref:lysine exporter LysO family protein n=1 Tax=Candidatus Arsenophonus nilaparvatae TaxID=1247023 RepID=UPI003877BAD6